MVRLTKMLAAGAAAALLALPAAGEAQMMKMMHGEEMGEGMAGLRLLLRAANLTPDQRNEVHDIMKSCHPQIRQLHEQMRALHEQIADKLTGAAPVTLADLAPLQQQLESLRSQMEQQHLKTALQIRALLTPAQLAQVASMHQKVRALHQQERELLGPPEGPEGEPPPPPPAP
ncbi:MAG: periplasmic heavy metal sensor [Myxococcales bacterium]